MALANVLNNNNNYLLKYRGFGFPVLNIIVALLKVINMAFRM